MKNLIMLLTMVIGIFLFSCEKKEDATAGAENDLKSTTIGTQKSAPTYVPKGGPKYGPKVDLINNEFPEAQEEVMETMAAITKSIFDGDMDKLISFHAYGPKFTEFKNGAPRNGGEENEIYERGVFGSVTEVLKMDAHDVKVAVYGPVANVTFHSDFELLFADGPVTVRDQITLMFVDTEDGWKIVHEHHSPLTPQ